MGGVGGGLGGTWGVGGPVDREPITSNPMLHDVFVSPPHIPIPIVENADTEDLTQLK